MRAESADLWHRRLGHINSRILDVLRKVEGNGICYTGNIEACDVCAIRKNAQQAHPKKATYDIKQPFQLVLSDLMGPMSPPVLERFQYVSKFVDPQTKWKEIFLINAKTDAIDNLKLFNQYLAILTGLRLECLRGDRGTEYNCSGIPGILPSDRSQARVRFHKHHQQIGANGRARRMLAAMVRCLLTDSGLPNFLWGELLQTAVYLSNRVPRTALGNITSYKALYGKDANLGYLRTIGARAFVHLETHT